MPSKLKEKLKFFESLSSSSHQNARNPRTSFIHDETSTQQNNNNNNTESTPPRNGRTSARNSLQYGTSSEDSKVPRKTGRFRLVGEDIVYEEEPQIVGQNSSSNDDSGNHSSSFHNKKKKDSLYRVVKLDKETNEIKERELDSSKQASRRSSLSLINNKERTRTDSKSNVASSSQPSKPIIEDFTTITEQLDEISDSRGEVPLVNNRRKPLQEESVPQSKEGIAEVVVDAISNANVISAPKTPRRLPPITQTPRSPVPPLVLASFSKTLLPSPTPSDRSSSLDTPIASPEKHMAVTSDELQLTVESLALRKQMEEEDTLEVLEGRRLFKQLDAYMQGVALKKDLQHTEARTLLEKQLNDVNIENQALTEQIEWFKLQIDEVHKTRDCQDSLITSLQQELQQTSRLNDELSLRIDSQDQTIRNLETQLKKYKSYASGVQEYEQMIAKLNKNVSTLTSDLQKAQQENRSQATMLQTLQADNKQLCQQIVQIEESLLCVICTEKVADCVASPCHHQAVCDSCCRAKNLAQCVLCRAQVHKYLKVYVNWTPKNLK